MKYVDVILPLPLPGMFTYSVPEGMEGCVVFGKRVLVPLGKSKKYIAMVVKVHQEKPSFKVKPIEQVLDATPTLLDRQYRLWSWISNYYMSPLGDVYNAAMPAGMKSAEKFKPRMELYVELTSKYRNEASLHVALNMLQRALKQSKALTTFLSLSHWDSLENDTPREGIKKVTKEELMNEAHCTSAIVKSLIDRDILFTYEEEVGRLNTSGESHFEQIKPLSIAQQEAYNKILLQMMKKKCGASSWRDFEWQDRGVYPPHQAGSRQSQAGALSSARDSSHGTDHGTSAQSFWRSSWHLSFQV